MTKTIPVGGSQSLRRQALAKLRPWLDAPVVKVLTGVRRCGKSVLLQQLRDDLVAGGVPDDHVILINFESLANEPLTNYPALYRHLMERITDDGRWHVFLDEVQLVDQWERVVNSLRVDANCDIVVTGSNAWLLSSDLATLLTGRYVEFGVYPFSFAEHLQLVGDGAGPNTEAAFRSYLDRGGMPGTHEVGDDDAALTYLRDVSNSILLKDVVARKRLRDIDLLQRLLVFVMDNLGRPFSANSVGAFLKNQRRSLGAETVYNYLAALSDAHLIYKAERFDVKGKRVLETQEKYYLADHGFAHAWLGRRPDETPGVLENIVYLELRRRGFEVRIGKQGDREIDFVANRTGERIYIQVCTQMVDQATVDRELAPLAAIEDNHRKLVLSLDQASPSNRDGIERRYLPGFLLDDTW